MYQSEYEAAQSDQDTKNTITFLKGERLGRRSGDRVTFATALLNLEPKVLQR
jgi:hypothetical protein